VGTIATVLNWCIWLGFLTEFVVMSWVVPDRWLWIRNNPLDLAIVVLTPPFLPESLQAARVFRLCCGWRKPACWCATCCPRKESATLLCWP